MPLYVITLTLLSEVKTESPCAKTTTSRCLIQETWNREMEKRMNKKTPEGHSFSLFRRGHSRMTIDYEEEDSFSSFIPLLPSPTASLILLFLVAPKGVLRSCSFSSSFLLWETAEKGLSWPNRVEFPSFGLLRYFFSSSSFFGTVLASVHCINCDISTWHSGRERKRNISAAMFSLHYVGNKGKGKEEKEERQIWKIATDFLSKVMKLQRCFTLFSWPECFFFAHTYDGDHVRRLRKLAK